QLAMTADRTEETLDFARRALDLADRFGDYAVQAHSLNNMGAALLKTGIEYCEVHKVETNLAYIRAHSAHFDLDRGRWDKAAQIAAELIEHHVIAISQRVPALVVLAIVRARRGDPGVDPLLDEAIKLALPTGELQRIGRVAATRAEVAWYRGDLKRVAAEAATG